VILQAGVLDLGTRFEEVMAAAREFPESWTMVFQSSRPLQLPTEFEQLKAPRTIVNPVPLRYEEVEPLVRSATVGVALYRVLSPNTLLKGAAAGKLAMYLKCGVPVVAQDLPSFVHLVEGYGCGVLVHDTSELGSAVERILAEYERFRAGALACFAAEFALDPHLDRLAGLLKSHA
jgi:glycosyltransferase involved in cell wall biosynthesis